MRVSTTPLSHLTEPNACICNGCRIFRAARFNRPASCSRLRHSCSQSISTRIPRPVCECHFANIRKYLLTRDASCAILHVAKAKFAQYYLLNNIITWKIMCLLDTRNKFSYDDKNYAHLSQIFYGFTA